MATPMSSATVAATTDASDTSIRKECAGVCIDYLVMELVHHYQSQQAGPTLTTALESIGGRIGTCLIERCMQDKDLFREQLDIMKFICKEFWTEMFKKPVDNLRTNHRGTYVMRDTQFHWLAKLSQNMMPPAIGQPLPLAVPKSDLSKDYLVLPCAIIKGALAKIGLDCTVTADASQLPQCDFTVVVVKGR